MDRTRAGASMVRAMVLGAVLAGMLGGCAATVAGPAVDVDRLGSATRILIYRDGKPVSESAVAAGSEADRLLRAWLRSHADGWRRDRNSYAPTRYVQGPRFTLNFQKDRCVLNFQAGDGGRWVQVSRPILRGDPIPAIFGEPE